MSACTPPHITALDLPQPSGSLRLLAALLLVLVGGVLSAAGTLHHRPVGFALAALLGLGLTVLVGERAPLRCLAWLAAGSTLLLVPVLLPGAWLAGAVAPSAVCLALCGVLLWSLPCRAEHGPFVLAVACGLGLALAPMLDRSLVLVPPFGDEPIYFINVRSLAVDGDLNLTNQALDSVSCGYVPGGKLSHWDTSPWSVRVGFPLLLTPWYGLAGTWGMSLWTGLAVVLCGALVFRWLAGQGLPLPQSAGWAALASVASPLLLYGGRVFPETTAALALLLAVSGPRWCRLPLLAGLVLLKVRYLPLSLGFAAVELLALAGSWPRRAALGGVALLVLGGALAADVLLFGGTLVVARYADWLGNLGMLWLPDLWLVSLTGLLLDQEYGLLWLGPVCLLGLGALLARLRELWTAGSAWSAGSAWPAAAAGAAVYLLSLLVFRGNIWYGGLNPGARFLAVLLPLAVLALAGGRRAGLRKAALLTELLAVTQLVLVLSVGWAADGLVPQLSGRDWRLAWVGELLGLPVSALLPSLVRAVGWEVWLAVLCGVAGLAALLHLVSRHLASLRAAGPAVLLGGGAVLLLGASSVTSPLYHAEDLAFPSTFRLGSPPAGVTLSPRDADRRLRQDLSTPENYHLVMGSLLDGSARYPWTEHPEQWMERPIAEIWPEYLAAAQGMSLRGLRARWLPAPQAVVLASGASLELPPVGGPRLALRVRKEWSAWRRDKPARLALFGAAAEGDRQLALLMVQERLWETATLAGEVREGEVGLRVQNVGEVPFEVDWLRWTGSAAQAGGALLPRPERNPTPGAAASLTIWDFEPLSGDLVPWVSGWTLYTPGEIGATLELPATGRYEVRYRVQSLPAEHGQVSVEARLNGELLEGWAVTDAAWREGRLQVALPAGKHQVTLRMSVTADAAGVGLRHLTVDRVDFFPLE